MFSCGARCEVCDAERSGHHRGPEEKKVKRALLWRGGPAATRPKLR